MGKGLPWQTETAERTDGGLKTATETAWNVVPKVTVRPLHDDSHLKLLL